MTASPPLLVKVLNAALGTTITNFEEARTFLRSEEGDALLEAWLAAHRDDAEGGERTA